MQATLLFILLVIIVLYVYTAIIWFVWNLVVPSFGGPEATYFQVFGIYVLIQLLIWNGPNTKSN